MSGFAIGKTLNYGYPGNVSHLPIPVITPRVVRPADTSNISFGDPVVLNSDGTYSLFGATNTASNFAGFAVREVKQATLYTTPQGYYTPGQVADVIELGEVNVTCTEGTPAAGGPVYVVTAVATSGGVAATQVGNIIANPAPAGTGGTAVELTNCQWKLPSLDANNVGVVAILTRNKA